MDVQTQEKVIKEVDMLLALQGEAAVDGAAVRSEVRLLLATEEFETLPTKRSEQIGFYDRLATAALSRLGLAPQEAAKGSTQPIREGFADTDDGTVDVIRRPIGY